MESKEIIYGRNPVLQYIRKISPDRIAALHISSGAHGKIIDTIVSEAKKRSIRILYEEKGFFSRHGSSAQHQGVALDLTGTVIDHDSSTLLSRAKEKDGILVLLDQITDPQNTGAIIRTAEALGCSGVILPRAHSSGINATVVKASAGATAHIDIVTVPNIASFLSQAKEAGFWIIGTSDHGTGDISSAAKLKPAVVIIGSEGSGMRRLTEEKCDSIIGISLKGATSSLNASAAAAIILYQLTR